MSKNIFGRPLQKCSCNGKETGWKRNGYCSNDRLDSGTHIVCARVTKKFLEFTRTKGNDLITPNAFFPGLVPGDCWCLCIGRWIEAYRAGVAPPIFLERSDQSVLNYVDLDLLLEYALD